MIHHRLCRGRSRVYGHPCLIFTLLLKRSRPPDTSCPTSNVSRNSLMLIHGEWVHPFLISKIKKASEENILPEASWPVSSGTSLGPSTFWTIRLSYYQSLLRVSTHLTRGGGSRDGAWNGYPPRVIDSRYGTGVGIHRSPSPAQ